MKNEKAVMPMRCINANPGKDEMREGKQITNPNRCKYFEFNPVDVLDENKKYRPREPKQKNIEGQVSFL